MADWRTDKLVQILPPLKDCIYTQQYCEENVWHLCAHVRAHHWRELHRCYVVFVSNASRTVPLWRQRCGHSDDKIIVWDYHVILVYHPDHRCLVYDLDTQLPFPTHFHKYVVETFRTDHILHPHHHRKFRVVPASVYLCTFASDRSHMLNADGTWLAQPPSYPPIATTSCTNNLQQFISMPSDETINPLTTTASAANSAAAVTAPADTSPTGQTAGAASAAAVNGASVPAQHCVLSLAKFVARFYNTEVTI